MAGGWDGSGGFTRYNGTYEGAGIWASEAGDGDAKIKSANHDTHDDILSAGILNCVAKDGQNAWTGDLDAGSSYHVTNLAAPAATGDSGRWDEDVSTTVFDSGTNLLTTTFNDSSTITADFSGLAAGTGGVDLTTAQTVAGVKTFSSATSLSEAKFNGPTKHVVDAPTPGANVTIDTTAAKSHYATVGQNTDVTFTWPTQATDAELGANWGVTGEITFRVTSAGKTITLNATMLAALDVQNVEGSAASGSNDLSTLTYNYKYIGGTQICQFAWVSTP